VGAGLSYGPAGATHHSIEDIAIMRSLPNMTVCCPGDPIEVREIVRQSVGYQGPMYIRLGKNGEPIIHDQEQIIAIGQSVQLTQGNDLIMITTSNMLEEGNNIVTALQAEGIKAALISMHTVKPLDIAAVHAAINKGIPIVTLEEHSIIGGLGSAVAEVIAESGQAVRFKRIGIKDMFCHDVGSQAYLRDKLINPYQEILNFMV
jgi:transketolase